MSARFPPALETISVEVPESALEAYEAALGRLCASVGFFKDDATGLWRVEGVREAGAREPELAGALALAATASGITAAPTRTPTAAEGWLALTYAGFPEQRVGRRFVVRGSHLAGEAATPGRIPLVLDAGLAFGSGEHGSTRGCLRALERVAHRKPRRILDLGTGSGILAVAAARLLHRRVLATDIEPWSVRVARDNARQNGVGGLVRTRLADGWRARLLRRHAPYDLVFANILARPLCRMAWPLSVHIQRGGSVILAGLLATQARFVLSAHLRRGFRLEVMVREGPWATLVLRAGRWRPDDQVGPPPQVPGIQPARRRRAASWCATNVGSNTNAMSSRRKPMSASSRSDMPLSVRNVARRSFREASNPGRRENKVAVRWPRAFAGLAETLSKP